MLVASRRRDLPGLAGSPLRMTLQIAVAVLERDGAWLLQLRDDIDGIVFPGTWGLFGGHLDAGETPEQGLRRELVEEIGWQAGPLELWFSQEEPHRVLHVFRGPLNVSLAELSLQEGQDMTLATPATLEGGRIWSQKLSQHRPLAPSLQHALSRFRRLD